MSNSNIPSSTPASSPFPRRLGILFLLVIDTVLGLTLLFRMKPGNAPLIVWNIFADLALGLVAGFGTRIFLRQRGPLVRFFAGTAAVIVGLYLLGMATNWQIGFGPLQFWPLRKTIDWVGLEHISIGTVTFLLAMQAWSRSVRVSPTANIPAVAVVPAREAAQPAVRPAPSPKVKPKRKKPKQPRASLNFPTRGRVETRTSAKPVIGRPVSKPATKPRRSLFQRKPQVHLSKIERHLCPYCLDPVTRNDPRGVWECDICHTLHHGDCYAIAGACQVPHYTS